MNALLCYVNLNHKHIAVGIRAAGLFERPALEGRLILYHHARKTRYAERLELGTHWGRWADDDSLRVF